MRIVQLILAVSLSVAAADDRSSFQQLDSDRDGRLSPREASHLVSEFREFDSDADGYLSREELREAQWFTGGINAVGIDQKSTGTRGTS